MDANRIKRWGWHVLALLFFAYIFGMTTNFSLNDPDLWWHLRTGQQTVETRSIPHDDPFSYTTPRPLSHAQVEGLRAHWLGQVIYFSLFNIDGLAGVIIFRGFLIVLPMLTIYFWFVDRGGKPWTALAIVSLGAFMLATELFYAFERPQGISFLLSVFLIILLEELRQEKRLALVILPLMMVFWSNAHAGFIVGNVIIMLYLTGEIITWLAGRLRKSGEKPNAVFFAGAALGLLGSGANPNGFTLMYKYLYGLEKMFMGDISRAISRSGDGGWVQNVVLEFKPLIYFYKELFYRWLIYYWIFTGVLLLMLVLKYWMKKRIDLTELLTVCFVSFFANYYARGLMFSIVILSFYFAKSVIELKDFKRRFMSLGLSRSLPSLFSTTAAALTLFFVISIYAPLSWAFKPGFTKQPITPWYPISAVNFLKSERIAPPMYNFYTWGGVPYLGPLSGLPGIHRRKGA